MSTISFKSQFYDLFKVTMATALVAFLLVGVANVAQAASLNDLKQEKQGISSKISQDSASKKQKEAEKKQLEQIISGLNQQISATQKKIQETQNKINQTQGQINELSQAIKQKEQELAVEQEKKRRTLEALYIEASRQGFMAMVLTSNSLSEVVQNTDYIDALETRIETTIAEITRLKTELKKRQQDLINKKAELQKLRTDQQNYKKALEGQQAAKSRALSDTKAVITDLQSRIADAKKRQAEVDSQIASIIAAQSKGSGRGIVARDRGTSAVGLQWPLDYIYISQYFGEPWNFNPATPHTGLDLVNAPGTPIFASAGGTVIWAGSLGNYGYGRYVIIGHNARFVTLYGHMGAITVSAGDEVKQGELIGDISGDPGNWGYATGPHTHFEVWENGSRVNPLSYLP